MADGATVIPLPYAAENPVQQQRRGGRLPKSVPSVVARRTRIERERLAERESRRDLMVKALGSLAWKASGGGIDALVATVRRADGTCKSYCVGVVDTDPLWPRLGEIQQMLLREHQSQT